MNRSLSGKLFPLIMAALFASIPVYAADNCKKSDCKEVNPALLMGPGPVVSISENYASLPAPIKEFIPKHFKNASVKHIEKKTLENVYEVELSNGYELEFTANGNWRKIEAQGKKGMSRDLLRSLLPAEAYRYLVKNKAEKKVREISFDPRTGYKVELKKHRYDELYFNTAGVYRCADD